MASFLNVSRLSFKFWEAPRHLLDVHLSLFFGPLAHASNGSGQVLRDVCAPACNLTAALQGVHLSTLLSILIFLFKVNFFNLGGSRSDPAPLKQIQKQGSKNGDQKTGIQNGDAKMSGTFQFSDLGHFNKFGVKQSGRVNGG